MIKKIKPERTQRSRRGIRGYETRYLRPLYTLWFLNPFYKLPKKVSELIS